MFATVRRYEGIDASHKDELTKKVGESLAPRLSELPGFTGYFLIDTGEGVMRQLFGGSTDASQTDPDAVERFFSQSEPMRGMTTTSNSTDPWMRRCSASAV